MRKVLFQVNIHDFVFIPANGLGKCTHCFIDDILARRNFGRHNRTCTRASQVNFQIRIALGFAFLCVGEGNSRLIRKRLRGQAAHIQHVVGKQRVHDVFHGMIAILQLFTHAQIEVHFCRRHQLRVPRATRAQLHALGTCILVRFANKIYLIVFGSHLRTPRFIPAILAVSLVSVWQLCACLRNNP